MSTDHEREALWKLVTKPDVDGTAPTTAQIVTRILAAGWIRRPEPRSPEWEAMVGRATDAASCAIKDGLYAPYRIEIEAALRAALAAPDR